MHDPDASAFGERKNIWNVVRTRWRVVLPLGRLSVLIVGLSR
jgi:hypothetical protein